MFRSFADDLARCRLMLLAPSTPRHICTEWRSGSGMGPSSIVARAVDTALSVSRSERALQARGVSMLTIADRMWSDFDDPYRRA